MSSPRSRIRSRVVGPCRQLASSVENYNKAVGSLERSVLPGARKFVDLGVHAKKDVEKLETLEPVPRTMIEGNDS